MVSTKHRCTRNTRVSQAAALSQAIHDGESQVELWYPANKRPFECVVAYSSFQPLILYYLHKIKEWNCVFQKCKICDNFFLARSRHYELCSDECRRVQGVNLKREFEERIHDNDYEQKHDNAYQYWYNRLRRLKRAKIPDADKIKTVPSKRLRYSKKKRLSVNVWSNSAIWT